MSTASLFNQFRSNLSVKNSADISTKYRNITARLNKDFWDSDSNSLRSLQIGSYGRHTAINGISDLDMVFEMPIENYERYKTLASNGPSTMLREVRESLLKRYGTTDVKADGQIVGVHFSGYRVEVLPAFCDTNGNYIHGDTNNGGRWKTTKPRPEIRAVIDLDKVANGNLKNACKMLRAWKNQVGVGIGGLLIDTLVFNFFSEHTEYHSASYAEYPEMLVSLFTYLGGLEEQDYWAAPGSRQRVRCKVKFQPKARKAAARCQEAVDAESEKEKSKIWRKVFGRKFPKPVEALKTAEATARSGSSAEEFIEDKYALDVRYNIDLDCEIRESNALRDLLRQKLRRRERVPKGRHLKFYMTACDVPGNYAILWKVRNRGPEAVRKGMLRGEITFDENGRKEKVETADFPGNHYVEVYAVKDGVCVARELISVPI